MPNAISRGQLVAIATYFVALFVYGHQKWWESPTAASRLCLLYEVCAHHQVAIDHSILITPDTARAKGRLFSDKAPGMVVAAFPGFACGWALAGASGATEKPRLLAASWLGCATSAAMVLAMGSALLCTALARRVGPRTAFLTVTALMLGGMPWVYATVMHSHSLVIGVLCVALWAALAFDPEGNSAPPLAAAKLSALFGFCLGWALASEYTSGLMVLALGIYFLSSAGLRPTIRAVLSAIPPLLMIPLYSWMTIGDPFQLPYSYQSTFPEMKKGLYAIRWPDAQTAYQLLFSSQRGLLFWSPCLGLAIFGYPRLLRQSPKLFWLAYAAPLLQLIVISGRVWDWPAGPTFGPRYLAPMLPLLALPLAIGLQRVPLLAWPLAAYSIAVTGVANVTDACQNYYSSVNPLVDVNWPLFITGQFGPNLGTAVGLPPNIALAAFGAVLVFGFYAIYRTLPPDGTAEMAGGDVAPRIPDATNRSLDQVS